MPKQEPKPEKPKDEPPIAYIPIVHLGGACSLRQTSEQVDAAIDCYLANLRTSLSLTMAVVQMLVNKKVCTQDELARCRVRMEAEVDKMLASEKP